MSRKPTPCWHPISALPLFASMAQEGLEGAMEQYAALQAAAPTPYVLDDYTVHRVLEVYTAQRDDLWVFEEQLQRWLRETLTNAQRQEVERLVTTLATMKQTVQQILALAEELKHGTIDTILAMRDDEVACAVLSGELPDPLESKNSPSSVLPTLTVNASFIDNTFAKPDEGTDIASALRGSGSHRKPQDYAANSRSEPLFGFAWINVGRQTCSIRSE